MLQTDEIEVLPGNRLAQTLTGTTAKHCHNTALTVAKEIHF